MPAIGDQHKSNGATTVNPFEDNKPQISEYTAQEIATLQSRLNKRLGPEFISTRPGPGNQKVAYLSAEKAINLANEVFGFNGWSSSIQNIQIDFVDESPSGKISLGLSVVVRVTLKDGTYHEDIGYGGIENCKGKAMAFEKSKKEATTDALKRALRSFGNVLGNCMYDRDYVTKVSKVKAGNGRFDVNELHRHPDFAPKAIEEVKPPVPIVPDRTSPPSLEFEDSFDVSEFDDIDFTENDLVHPEEIVLPTDLSTRQSAPGPVPGIPSFNTPSKAPQPPPRGAHAAGQNRPQAQQSGSFSSAISGRAIPPNQQPRVMGTEGERSTEHNSSSPGVPSEHFAARQAQIQSSTGAVAPPPAGFYSAKAAQRIDPTNISDVPPHTIKFNPHAESPSIRKTAGVDHTKSVPVRREVVKADTIVPPSPGGDINRRIGLPGQPNPNTVGRPGGLSTSAYRPPTRNGSSMVSGSVTGVVTASNTNDRAFTAAKRPPLGDVSNVQHSVTASTSDGADAKRQKTGAASSGNTTSIRPNENVDLNTNSIAGT